MDLASATCEAFAPHVGTAFTVAAEVQDGQGRPLVLTLVDATARGEDPPAGRAPFALIFTGPAEPLLAQQIVPLDHAALGELALFVVPIGVDDRGARYEAIFN